MQLHPFARWALLLLNITEIVASTVDQRLSRLASSVKGPKKNKITSLSEWSGKMSREGKKTHYKRFPTSLENIFSCSRFGFLFLPSSPRVFLQCFSLGSNCKKLSANQENYRDKEDFWGRTNAINVKSPAKSDSHSSESSRWVKWAFLGFCFFCVNDWGGDEAQRTISSRKT